MSAGLFGAGILSRLGSVQTNRAGFRGVGIARLRGMGSAAVVIGGHRGTGFARLRNMGDVSGAKSGSGTLTAQAATLSGTANRVIVDLGGYDELVAGSATMSGTATLNSTGISTGILNAQAATMTGTGTVNHEWSSPPSASGGWTKITPSGGGWTRQ